MITTLTAEAALDAANHGKVLVCFARQEDVDTAYRLLERYTATLRFKVVRVEPSVEAAQTLQLPRFPTFVLFEDGAERFQAVGADQLAEAVARFIR